MCRSRQPGAWRIPTAAPPPRVAAPGPSVGPLRRTRGRPPARRPRRHSLRLPSRRLVLVAGDLVEQRAHHLLVLTGQAVHEAGQYPGTVRIDVEKAVHAPRGHLRRVADGGIGERTPRPLPREETAVIAAG